jgi:hypothetical protein
MHPSVIICLPFFPCFCQPDEMKAELEAKLAKAESNKDATIHKRVSDAAASVVSASRLLLHVKLRLLPMTWLVAATRCQQSSSALVSSAQARAKAIAAAHEKKEGEEVDAPPATEAKTSE